MFKRLFTAGLILLLLGGFLFIGEKIQSERTETIKVPYTVEVPYTEEVKYSEVIPYIEEIPFEVEVEINRTEYILNITDLVYDVNMIYAFDFSIETSRELKIKWITDEELTLFAIIKQELVDSIVPIITTSLTENPEALESVVENLEDQIEYYKASSNSNETLQEFPPGNYLAVLTITNAPITLDIEISYRYEGTEIQIKNKRMVNFKVEEKTKNETKYKVETRYNKTTRTYNQSILNLPKINYPGWTMISIGIGIVGITTIIVSYIRK